MTTARSQYLPLPVVGQSVIVGFVWLCGLAVGGIDTGATPFRRGDCTGDGILDLTDPVANLEFQFLGSFTPPCRDACDFDDVGSIDITDPIANLAHQFLGGPPPAPPGKETCGTDPTDEDGISCESFAPCESVPHARIVLLSESEPIVTSGQRVPISVRYVDPQNSPIAGVLVSFETRPTDTADTRLSARNSLTDAEGFAETFIEAGIQQVDFDVIVSVPGDDTVEPISISVRIQPQSSSDIIVRVTYDGPLGLSRVEVLLFDVDRACSSLNESPTDAPSTDVAWTSLVILPDAEGNIPERALSLPGTVELHYAVARGEPSDGQGDGAGYFATFGCTGIIPSPDPAGGTIVDIEMHNLWPEVQGKYQVTLELDVLAARPEALDPVLSSVMEFFTDPGVGLLRLAALAIAGDDYYLESPWDLLFECPEDLPRTPGCEGPLRPTAIGLSAAATLESHVDARLAQLPDTAGGTLRETLSAGTDVFDTAERFVLSGDLVIPQDPDAAGLLGDTNEIVFNRLTWVWAGHERTLDLREESFLRGPNIPARIVFHPDPDRADKYSLELEPFDLSLNHGELLIWVLEGIVFAEFLSPQIQSMEDLFGILIDGEDLADHLACLGEYARDPRCDPVAGFAAAAVEAAASALEVSADSALEDWLTSVQPGFESWYRLGTPANRPCPLTLVPAGGKPFSIQTLGSALAPCECEGGVHIHPSDEPPEEIGGAWWGEKL